MSKDFKLLNQEDLTERSLFPGGKVIFTHSENMTLAEWHFEKGVIVPEHSHPHEQITRVLSGSFELTVEGKKYTLSAGSSGIIPSNAVHSGKSLSLCHLVDVFNPVREDYR